MLLARGNTGQGMPTRIVLVARFESLLQRLTMPVSTLFSVIGVG